MLSDMIWGCWDWLENCWIWGEISIRFFLYIHSIDTFDNHDYCDYGVVFVIMRSRQKGQTRFRLIQGLMHSAWNVWFAVQFRTANFYFLSVQKSLRHIEQTLSTSVASLYLRTRISTNSVPLSGNWGLFVDVFNCQIEDWLQKTIRVLT